MAIHISLHIPNPTLGSLLHSLLINNRNLQITKKKRAKALTELRLAVQISMKARKDVLNRMLAFILRNTSLEIGKMGVAKGKEY